jgi:hypothetical protein
MKFLRATRSLNTSCVLDVGGGQGTFVGRLAQHAKHLQLRLFDLPEVAALWPGPTSSVKALLTVPTANPGSFLEDALPRGADLVTLIRVAHDHPDADVKTALRAIYEALPVGGTLLLAEPMAQEARRDPSRRCVFPFLPAGHGRRQAAYTTRIDGHDERSRLLQHGACAQSHALANPNFGGS